MTLTGCRGDKLVKKKNYTPTSQSTITVRYTTRRRRQHTRLSLILQPGLPSVFSFEPMDHRSQPKCNWTRRAASRLSLSLIINYNRGQLKLPKVYSKQCWFYYPQQRNLMIPAKRKMESRLGFLFPTDADWKPTMNAVLKVSMKCPKAQPYLSCKILLPTTSLLITVIFHYIT